MLPHRELYQEAANDANFPAVLRTGKYSTWSSNCHSAAGDCSILRYLALRETLEKLVEVCSRVSLAERVSNRTCNTTPECLDLWSQPLG